MKNKQPRIKGNLDIFVINHEEEFEGKTDKWNEVLIHGDPEGLKSLAKLLNELAEMDQNQIENLPIGAREHIHLIPNYELSSSSDPVIIGRLDAKGTQEFYERFSPKNLV